ncbi:hypothetical protein Tco_0500102 [Tanacetum coccineum]
MSPASKSKSKDKRVAGREPQKSSTKPTSITNTGGSVPTSGYNTLLGTFHALETKDRIGNSVGMGIEYDSLSNSGGGASQFLDTSIQTADLQKLRSEIEIAIKVNKRLRECGPPSVGSQTNFK